jgi:virginiamycin B lyase
MVGTPSTPVSRAASRVTAALIALATVAVLVPAAIAAAPPELSEFPLAEGVSPFGIAQGSDGAMWFTERATDSVGRIEPDGTLGPWVALEIGADPTAIAPGVDGAVWFTEQGTNRIGRIAPDGFLSEFPVPTDTAAVAGITAGPDGAMWFTERSAHRIGRIATDGTISEFTLPSSLPGPLGITAGPDGALWFTEHRGNRIGRITTSGDVTEWPLPFAASVPSGIAAGPDGALWFTMRAANRIGRITTSGDVTTYPVPTAASDPTAITAGWDGAMWFTGPDTDVIGRVALDGSVTEFRLPTVGSSPFSIAAGPDDAVWFTEGNANAIGRLGAPATPADTSPPTIRIDSPADGGVVVPGSGHAADFLCADDGGSGLATCVGTVPDGAAIDTLPGSHRFDVHAVDGAGNTASASAWYLAFADIDGSITSGSQRAGQWATLELDLGAKAPRNASDVVADGFPVSRQVDCADPSIDRTAASPADARLSTRQTLLVTRWRTDRAWAGTCRAITFRFVAPGWTGADATFVVAFR